MTVSRISELSIGTARKIERVIGSYAGSKLNTATATLIADELIRSIYLDMSVNKDSRLARKQLVQSIMRAYSPIVTAAVAHERAGNIAVAWDEYGRTDEGISRLTLESAIDLVLAGESIDKVIESVCHLPRLS